MLGTEPVEPDLQLDRSTLRWLSSGLDDTLLQARRALEDYHEGVGDDGSLAACVEHLHRLEATLAVAQVYGAAMLAGEMEALGRALSGGAAPVTDQAVEVLMIGLLQLPGYLEKVEAGEPDIPLGLLPLMNDLRSARGADPVSEINLFAPRLDKLIHAESVEPESAESSLGEAVSRARNGLLRAMLAWFQQQDSMAGVRQMRDGIARLAAKARTDRIRRLFDSVEALLVVVQENGAAADADIKRLFGQLDRYLKRIQQVGEQRAAQDFPTGLLKGFLYQVARSESDDPTVRAVRGWADLANSFPAEIDREVGLATLAGTERELLQAVNQALSQDLRTAKDTLDLFIRGGRSESDRLGPLIDPLRRIGDTLGMIGQGELRTRLNARSRQISEGAETLSDEELMQAAGDILHVESVLAGLAARPLAEARPPGDSLLTDGELTGYVGAALQETFVELGQVKETLGTYLGALDEPGLLGDAPERLHTVAGAVRLLELPQAGEMIEGLAGMLAETREGRRAAFDADQAAALADALTGVEYYLEAVREQRANCDEILGFARQAVTRLGIAVAGPIAGTGEESPPEPPVEAEDAALPDVEAEIAGEAEARPETGTRTEPRPEAEAGAGSEVEAHTPAEDEAAPEPETGTETEAQGGVGAEAETAAEVEAPADEAEPETGAGHDADIEAGPDAESPPDAIVAAIPPALDADIDEEILETFYEEADEELERIAELYPAWRGRPDDRDALTTVRRSFHTLKGSGRLVGAQAVGELSWSIESLLNRVIEGTVSAGPELFELMDEACAALPALIEAQRRRTPLTWDLAAISDRAEALSRPAGAGGPEAAALEEAHRAEPEPTDGEAQAAAGEPPAVAEPAGVEADSPPEAEPRPEPLIALPRREKVLQLTAPVEAQLPEVLDEPDREQAAAGEAGTDSRAEAQAEAPAEASPGAPPEEADERAAAGELPAFQMPGAQTPADLGLEPLSGVAAQGPSGASKDGTEAAEASAEEAFDDDTVDVDSTLLGIFCAEGREHLDVLAAFLDRASREPEAMIDADLQRAIHTLRGSANAAAVSQVAELSGGLDRLLTLWAERKRPSDPTLLDLLERGHQTLADMLEAVDQGQDAVPDDGALLERLDAVSAGLEAAPATATAKPTEGAYSAEEDSELLEIFLEESRELLEQIEEDFGRWQDEPQGRSAVAGLQRSLHTLKGGARLTGVTPVGDLSHVLESLFERVLNAELAAEQALVMRVRRAIDHIATAVEALRAGRPLPDLSDVSERLQALVTGELSTDDADSDLPPIAWVEEAGVATGPSAAGGGVEPPEEPLQAEPAPAGPPSDGPTADEPLPARPGERIERPAAIESATRGSSILRFPTGAPWVPPHLAAEPAAVPEPEPEQEAPAVERVRVRSDLLDSMVNHAGEVAIYRARLEQQNSLLGFDLQELDQTISRLREQLRKLELETETQILSRHERADDLPADADFDPLEMDRYSSIQQLSRALSETVNDLTNLGITLGDLKRDTDTLLGQQARVSNDLQDSLLRSRMIPFSSRLARLQRVVRQTADSLDRQAELVVQGGQGEVDRSILDRMMGPLEHLLRNAVAHGIEGPEQRRAAGKPERGVIRLELRREGPDVVLVVGDDGAGLNRDAIRTKALERGLLARDVRLDDDALYQLILEHGFSTAEAVNQIAGRGVGLDAVLREVKQLGGSLDVSSTPASGARFTVRLPFTLALTEALLMTVGEDVYAVPHTGIESVVRISRAELNDFYEGRRETFEHDGRAYQVRYLGTLLDTGLPSLPKGQKWFPLLLARAGDHRVAVHADALLGNREIVIKSIGPQLSTVRWFTGGTILADGRVALILDMGALLRADARTARPMRIVQPAEAPQAVSVMVVDDSITVRKVTSRLLERHDMQVLTAKDGVDAVTLLHDHRPDVMLLDVEMPRMDGYELARHMQNSTELARIPIIMITSRSGEKHREHARQLGVRHYLGKPYQESELLDRIFKVLEERRAS